MTIDDLKQELKPRLNHIINHNFDYRKFGTESREILIEKTKYFIALLLSYNVRKTHIYDLMKLYLRLDNVNQKDSFIIFFPKDNKSIKLRVEKNCKFPVIEFYFDRQTLPNPRRLDENKLIIFSNYKYPGETKLLLTLRWYEAMIDNLTACVWKANTFEQAVTVTDLIIDCHLRTIEFLSGTSKVKTRLSRLLEKELLR